MAETQTPSAQQREFVRVDDTLPFSWEKISDSALAEIIAYHEKHRAFPRQSDELGSILTALDNGERLKMLERKDPNLSKILGHIDLKLNLLLRLFHPGEDEGRPMTPTLLNLSGSGIAFWDRDVPLKSGDGLRLRISLAMDALASVVCYARVMRIFEDDRDGMARVGCRFEPILSQDQERIIQHIFKRQNELIRSQKK